MRSPEELAREKIDALLEQCGWILQNRSTIDLSAGGGIEAIRALERSLAANKRRALIQMATSSGKTYTAVNFVYRLIKLAGARRVLFLVDRGNLGDQTLKDWSSSDKTSSEGEARRVSAGSANQFQQFVTPDDGRKFTELYNVQHLQRSQREAVRHRREARRVDSRERINQSAQLDRVSRVCISTIQRLYSMLRWYFFGLKHRCHKARSRAETGNVFCMFNEACRMISVAR